MLQKDESPPEPDPNLRGSITKVKTVEEHEKQTINENLVENEKSVDIISRINKTVRFINGCS